MNDLQTDPSKSMIFKCTLSYYTGIGHWRRISICISGRGYRTRIKHKFLHKLHLGFYLYQKVVYQNSYIGLN